METGSFRTEYKQKPQKPIEIYSREVDGKKQECVRVMGVELPRAERGDSRFVPKLEQYQDIVQDTFFLNMLKNVAVGLKTGDPTLIEGGTSIGKTTALRYLSALANYEVHYANLNGATDVEDLMGRYIPNPNKHGAEDPEYIFADGKVTSGLRPEEGKTKVIILDEFNAAAPNILIRLHEVLDAVGRGGDVVLSEDASKVVPVDKAKTKVVALMNPPGKGYFGREPLDPAQLRRWAYTKAPTELPRETFSHATKALFGLASPEQSVSEAHMLPSRETALLPEQLQEIPGIADILARYEEFHQKAKQLVKERKVGADQPQAFTYDDRMEPKRVRDFILNFYNGNINKTMQEALRYYYANKLELDVDKDKLEEMIRLVAYVPPRTESARISLEEPRSYRPDSAGVLSELEEREQDAWYEVLGEHVEIKPLPSSVTPEVRRKLEAFGFELVYLPNLELGTLADLKRMGVGRFLDDLQRRYPNWKHYESMSDSEKRDHRVPRNLNEWYWELVKDENVNFPNLPGQWMAVEKVPKPAYGSSYESTRTGARLGFRDRFNVSWNDAKAAIDREKSGLLGDIGLRSAAEMRMLETLEWNLVANREGWGATDTYEWTNSEYRASGGSSRLVAGDSDDGGAAGASWDPPSGSGGSVGFRAAVGISLDKTQELNELLPSIGGEAILERRRDKYKKSRFI